MLVKNIKMNLSDIEIQKIFLTSVAKYHEYIKKMYAHALVALVLAIFNLATYEFVSYVTGECMVALSWFNYIFFGIAFITNWVLRSRYAEDLSMLESYLRCPVKDVKEDLTDFITVFGSWDKVDFLRTIEYANRVEVPHIEILNEAYYYITDKEFERMISFPEPVICDNAAVLSNYDEVNLIIEYNGPRLEGCITED